MNAELVLHLIEQDVSLDAAKAIAATEPRSEPELTLALIEHANVLIGDARRIAENAPLPFRQERVYTTGPGEFTNDPGPIDPKATDYNPRNPANRMTVPIVGPDGLTDKQRAALGTVGLCPNCQQPNTDHLPGCARQTGEDPRAVTKFQLPPAT